MGGQNLRSHAKRDRYMGCYEENCIQFGYADPRGTTTAAMQMRAPSRHNTPLAWRRRPAAWQMTLRQSDRPPNSLCMLSLSTYELASAVWMLI